MSKDEKQQPTMDDLLKHVADVKEIAIEDKVSGKIIFIAKNEVILDIENVGLGIVRGKELYNEEYLSRLKIGEEVEAIVLDLDNENGMIELSFRAIGRDKIWADIKEVFEEGKTVEAKIRDANRGGFMVQVHGVYGFLPASLLAPAHAIKQGLDGNNLLNQMKKYVGQVFNVKIININEEEDTLIASEKAVSDEIAAAKLSKYKVGDIVEGNIVGVVDFGVFIRFDEDLEGMVHISEIAWKKVEDPKKEYKVGEKIKAKIIEIDDNNRINLSIKQTLPNPWNEFSKNVKEGDKFAGKVTKIVSYGAIVTSDEDIQGLCHISQIAKEKLESPAQIHDHLQVGETKEFTILTCDKDEKLFLTLLPLKEAKKREDEALKEAINEDLEKQEKAATEAEEKTEEKPAEAKKDK